MAKAYIFEKGAAEMKGSEDANEEKDDGESESLREGKEHGQDGQADESLKAGEVGGSEDGDDVAAAAGEEGKKHRVSWRKGAVAASNALSFARTAVKTKCNSTEKETSAEK